MVARRWRAIPIAAAVMFAGASCNNTGDLTIGVGIGEIRPAIVDATPAGGRFVVEVDVRVRGTNEQDASVGWGSYACELTAAPPEVTPTTEGCGASGFTEEEIDLTDTVEVTLDVLPGVLVGTYVVGFAATACAQPVLDQSPGGPQPVCDVAEADIVVRVTDPTATSPASTVPATTAPPVTTPATTAPPAAPPPAAATTPAPAPATTAPPTTAPAPAPTANLVADPSFDVQPAIGLLPSTPGVWTGDQSAIVGAGAVTPHSGGSMVQFLATGDVPSDRTETGQLWQVVDLAAYAAQIDAGGVAADGSAWFHRVVGGATTDRRFDLRLHAFDGAIADAPARYAASNPLALQAVSITTDGSAWTTATASLALPPGTRYVLVEIYAYEDVVNDASSPEFEGHYADDVSLTLTLP